MNNLSVDGTLPLRNRKESPLGLYIAVIKERPGSSELAHKAAFKRLLLSEGYEDFVEAVVEEWQSIKYSTALRAAEPPSIKEIKQNVEQRKNERKEEAALTDKVKQIIGATLLDIVLPNGSRLRESTFKYCSELGGFISAIGSLGKPGQIVGDVFTEERLRQQLRKRRIAFKGIA